MEPHLLLHSGRCSQWRLPHLLLHLSWEQAVIQEAARYSFRWYKAA